MRSLDRWDKIKGATTAYIVGVFNRGVIFSEHDSLENAKETIECNIPLLRDGYAIYTREEWNRH